MELQYHEALLRPALATLEFGPGAQALVVWGNWCTDLWTLGRLARTSHGAYVMRLHFLNLATPEAIADQWRWLEVHAAETLARKHTAHTALYTLGQLLHCVQDFYAHTNWVDLCLAAGVDPCAVPLWEEGLPPGAQMGALASAFYPDAAAPVPAWCHTAMHKDHPEGPAGALAFEAAMGAAQRATALWLPRLLGYLPEQLNPKLRLVPEVPLSLRAVLFSIGAWDRARLTRWCAGTITPRPPVSV